MAGYIQSKEEENIRREMLIVALKIQTDERAEEGKKHERNETHNLDQVRVSHPIAT